MGETFISFLEFFIPINIGLAAVLLAVYEYKRRKANEADRRMVGSLKIYIDRSQL